MNMKIITIEWKILTDDGHPRRRTVEIETPVERDTTALEDAVLAVPDIYNGHVRIFHQGFCAYRTPKVETPQESPPTDEQCVEAIRAAVDAAWSNVSEQARLQGEREQAKDAEAVSMARRFLEDETDPYLSMRYRDRLDRIDPVVAGQVDSVKALRKKVMEKKNEAARKERNRLSGEKAKQEGAVSALRYIEKLAWIEQHGSTRLQRQIEAKMSGWPLYLHERLAADLDDYEETQRWGLDNNGAYGDDVVNPSEEAIQMMLTIADRLVEIELEPDKKAALANLVIRTIEFPPDDNDDEYDYDEVEIQAGTYLVYDNYRPGLHPSWSVKSVRILMDE
jgi:hypothetical protein